MKKILSLILASLFVLTAFVGCGKDEKFDYTKADLSKYVTLGEYLGVTVEVEDRALTEDDIQKGIDSLLTENSETVKITDRVAADGDTVNISYVGKKDGIAFEGGTANGASLVLGSNTYIDGFEEGLVGVMPGATVDLNLTFPDPYKNNPDLAGAAVVFTVTLNHIEETVKPEWNDEFVKKLTENKYETTDAYLEVLKVEFENEKKTSIENKKLQDVWVAIINGCKILDYPKSELNFYYDEIIASYEDYAAQAGVDLDTLLAYMQTTKAELEDYANDYSKSIVAENLVLFSIVKKEGLEISAEEYEEGLANYAATFDKTVEELKDQFSEEEIRDSLLWDKTIAYLVEKATEVPATKKAE